MRRRVIRLGKRRTSWELDDPAAIAAVEFRDRARDALDLRPSVYLVDPPHPERIVQVRAEHSVSFMSPPSAQGTLEVDATDVGAGDLLPSIGATRFAYSRAVHAELVFKDENELLALVTRILAEREKRAVPISREALLSYIDMRLTAGDPEWLAVLGPAGEEPGSWGESLRKWRRSGRGQ